ncbi:putative 2-aminoethylphosphonate ABC transporter permease subunit [Ancylobacter terrae]|uniref:putative 2-aminoethylphosphonate ABC transporter permease subunit n=1 Tax=Ancylobacter sp. sgz301288 TaxID=3342077 RepID=UPI00385A0E59
MLSSLAGRAPSRITQKAERDERLLTLLLGAIFLFQIVAIVLPLFFLLIRSVQDNDGGFVGLANFRRFMTEAGLAQAAINSVFISSISTVITVSLGFAFAFLLTRTLTPFRSSFRALSMIPLLAPSLLPALALIYLFGQKGVLRDLMFGHSIYGPIGIVIAEVIFAFPQAVLILSTSLLMADQRLYDAALAMRAGPVRSFFAITLPSCRYGLVSATLAVFVKVFTDFGAPAVIGGSYPVLATEIFKQVIGLFDFSMGAVVGLFLLIPALLSFIIERWLLRGNVSMVSAQSVPLTIKPNRARDVVFLVFGVVVAICFVALVSITAFGSLVRYWPYNLSLTFVHYNFEAVDNTGLAVYLHSILLALLTSLFGTALIFLGAFLIETVRGAGQLRGAVHFLSMVPLAIPGLVLGLSYIFFFNNPDNPLNLIYGTITILVLSTIVHFYTVPHLIALTALKQIDREFNAVCASLRVSRFRMLRSIVAPICLPAIVDIWGYLFVNAMTTVSAVIFLFSADTQLASITIVRWNDAGKIAPASAMSIVIFGTIAAFMLVKNMLLSRSIRRTQQWRSR